MATTKSISKRTNKHAFSAIQCFTKQPLILGGILRQDYVYGRNLTTGSLLDEARLKNRPEEVVL